MRGVSPVDDVGLFTDSKLQAYFGGNYMLIQAYDLYDHKPSDGIAYFHRYDHYMQSFLVDVRDMSLVHTFIDTLIIENAYFPNTPDPSKHYANSLIDTLRYHRSGFSDDASKIAMVPYNVQYAIDIFDIKTLTTKRLNLPVMIYSSIKSDLPVFFDSTGNYIITSNSSKEHLIYNIITNEYYLNKGWLPYAKYKNTNYFTIPSDVKFYIKFSDSSSVPVHHSVEYTINNNKLHIFISDINNISKIEIFDIKSNLIYSKTPPISPEIEFYYPSGVYIIKALVNNKIETYKLIKN